MVYISKQGSKASVAEAGTQCVTPTQPKKQHCLLIMCHQGLALQCVDAAVHRQHTDQQTHCCVNMGGPLQAHLLGCAAGRVLLLQASVSGRGRGDAPISPAGRFQTPFFSRTSSSRGCLSGPAQSYSTTPVCTQTGRHTHGAEPSAKHKQGTGYCWLLVTERVY